MARISTGDAWKYFQQVDAGLRALAFTFMRACARRGRLDEDIVKSLAKACEEAGCQHVYNLSLIGVIASLDDLNMLRLLFSQVQVPWDVCTLWRRKRLKRPVHVVTMKERKGKRWQDIDHIDLVTSCGVRGSRASYTFDPTCATCVECCAQQVERTMV